MRRIPPLKSLRAFEAAARHGSFVEAADELAVTPSAISQQVKNLEDWLGRPLFRRLPRGLVATDTALAYLPAISEALDRIETATRAVVSSPAGQTVKVTCLASFGAQWLAPRLHRFSDRHPDIDVLLATFDRLVDLEREDFDLALRYGDQAYPTLRVEELLTEMVGVVCSPALLQDSVAPIRSLEDLAAHTLLHDADAMAGGVLSWDHFLKAIGAPPPAIAKIDPKRGLRFNDSHLIIQACMAGRGIMLGRSALIGDALSAGLLVAPFGLPIEAKYRYRMVMRHDALADPKVQAFRQWIYEELGKTPP